MPDKPQTRNILTAISLLILMSILVFWPGTSGDFILDDSFNLSPMQKNGGVHNLDTLRAFVFEGISGPTGRPVSLLSFLVDGQTWPTDPFPFKRTNILIHTFNGILIFAIIYKLLQIIGRTSSSATTIAFLCAAIWTLHPLQTSTVLYVIQRMTELVALFTLIGIWCYLHGRQMLLSSPGPGYLWMSTGVVIFGVLATLSKENGILLPLYILVIEFTLLQSTPRPKHWRYWAIPLLVMPVIFLLIYLGYVTENHAIKFAHRDFSLYERLLTEPRVLLDYIGKIIFPMQSPELFFDDFQISRSLLSPLTTILALASLLAALIASIAYRKSFPVLSFAVLWFLAGHLLESTVLPLEIYFEHRNYLPMLGFALAFCFYTEKITTNNKKLFIAAGTIVISLLASTTWLHSNTWGNNSRLIAETANSHPNSLRAQVAQTRELFRLGDDKAMAQLEKTKERFPQSLGIATVYVDALCQQGLLTKDHFMNLYKNSSTLQLDSYLGTSLPNLAKKVITEDCIQITPKGMIALINKISENHTAEINQQKKIKFLLLKSELYIKDHNLKGALKSLDQALQIKPSITIILRQAELLANANVLNAALGQLSLATAIDKMRSPLLPSRQNEIDNLRSKIETKMKLLSEKKLK